MEIELNIEGKQCYKVVHLSSVGNSNKTEWILYILFL